MTTIENPYNVSISTTPTYDGSTVVTTKDGTIDYASIANESYSDVHKNWGRTNDDVQHINFAAPTAPCGMFDVPMPTFPSASISELYADFIT